MSEQLTGEDAELVQAMRSKLGQPEPFTTSTGMWLGVCAFMTLCGAVSAHSIGFWPAIPFAVAGVMLARRHSSRLLKLSLMWVSACFFVFITQDRNPLLYPALLGGKAIAKADGCLRSLSSLEQPWNRWETACHPEDVKLIRTKPGDVFRIVGVKHGSATFDDVVVFLRKPNMPPFGVTVSDAYHFEMDHSPQSLFARVLGAFMLYPQFFIVSCWLLLP